MMLDTVTTRAPGRLLQQRQELRGEREVPEVVGPELRLEAVTRAAARRHHDARVVHQHVQPRVRGQHTRGAGGHRREVRQVERLEVQRARPARSAHLVHGGPRLGFAATREDDVGAVRGQRLGGLEAEPAVGAGDEHEATALVTDLVRREVHRRGIPHRRRARSPDAC
jgi:hypothetical protein